MQQAIYSTRDRGLLEHLVKIAPTEPEAFLRWGATLTREDGKFELSRGKVTGRWYGESRAHGRVGVNIFRALEPTLDRERFDIGFTDFAVRTPFGIRSPDLLVDSRERPQKDWSAVAPVLIVEVLSPASVGKDFTEKLADYCAIASLKTYLICSQDEPRAWVWQRQAGGAWPELPVEQIGRDGKFALGGLGVELSMAAIFRGIPDAPTGE